MDALHQDLYQFGVLTAEVVLFGASYVQATKPCSTTVRHMRKEHYPHFSDKSEKDISKGFIMATRSFKKKKKKGTGISELPVLNPKRKADEYGLESPPIGWEQNHTMNCGQYF